MDNLHIKTIDFNFIQSLFDKGWGDKINRGWKSFYFKNTQQVFEKNFKEMGLWGQHPSDKKKYGILSENGLWSWMNRINTHPNCCLSLYNWCIENNPNFFVDFGNEKFHEYNANKMWNYLDENFKLFFTTNITNKYYNQLKIKCQKSWNNGNITLISVIIGLKSCYGEIYDIDFTFDYGDKNDMNGIDLEFKLPNGQNRTVQVKSGKYLNLRDEFLVEGSVNGLDYKVDLYAYASVDSKTNLTSLIFFKNDNNLYKDGKYIVVNSELVECFKNENMVIPQKLNDILILCSKNNLEFMLKRDMGENYVKLDLENKKIEINIFDYNDNNLESILSEKLNELYQLLN